MTKCQVYLFETTPDADDSTFLDEYQGAWDVTPGTSMADFLQSAFYSLRWDCGGNGQCEQCTVEVAPIEYQWKELFQREAARDNDEEIGNLYKRLIPRPRLQRVKTCQSTIETDLLIRIPPEALLDYERKSPSTETTVATSSTRSQRIKTEGTLAIAVDLGTTTIVVALLDLCRRKVITTLSLRNPQIARGTDVISRIQYATRGKQQAGEMQCLLLESITESIIEILTQTRLDRNDIAKICIAGNSVMTSLLCGIDTTSLGSHPFVPKVRIFDPIPPQKTLFPVCPKAELLIVPLFAGFVGGDIVAGIIANRYLPKPGVIPPDTELFVDLGTNGEIALITTQRIIVTATAAGPAFEGAGIRFGMLAQSGVIDAFDLNEPPYFGGRSYYRTISNHPPRGICGSGLVDLVASLLRFGIIDSKGRFQPSETKESQSNHSFSPDQKIFGQSRSRICSYENRLGTFEEQKAFLITDNVRPIWLTQKDIRQIQLAVGAIRAGATLLLREAKVKANELPLISLAGSFGSVLNLFNAKQIGMFPHEMPIERIKYVGNSSLCGAAAILFYPELWEKAIELVKNVEHLDLATLHDFQEVFVESLAFPENPW